MEIPRHKVGFAAISFVVGMLLLFFAGGYLQSNFGMIGLVLTELMILAIALLSAVSSGLNLKETFRVRVSSGREWLASFLIYLSVFFGAATATYILTVLTPSIAETSSIISGFVLSGGFVLALIGVSILPGICEEAWHRGYLLTSLGSIKSVASRVLIMGLAFGLFHMDTTRFLQTMILGFGLSFMRIKTDNLLIPVTFHCANNLFSVAVTFLLALSSQSIGGDFSQTMAESSPETAAIQQSILLPLVCCTAALSILFLSLGLYNFKRVEILKRAPGIFVPDEWAPPLQKPRMSNRTRTILIVSICGGVALLSCFACIILSVLSMQSLI